MDGDGLALPMVYDGEGLGGEGTRRGHHLWFRPGGLDALLLCDDFFSLVLLESLRGGFPMSSGLVISGIYAEYYPRRY